MFLSCRVTRPANNCLLFRAPELLCARVLPAGFSCELGTFHTVTCRTHSVFGEAQTFARCTDQFVNEDRKMYMYKRRLDNSTGRFEEPEAGSPPSV